MKKIRITWGANEPMTLLVENPERLPDLVLDLCVLDFPENKRNFESCKFSKNCSPSHEPDKLIETY